MIWGAAEAKARRAVTGRRKFESIVVADLLDTWVFWCGLNEVMMEFRRAGLKPFYIL